MPAAGIQGLVPILIGSAIFYYIALFLSIRFVFLRRLGPPWLLVSAALFIMGCLSAWEAATVRWGQGSPDAELSLIALLVSLLFASGYLLTEKWFLLKERLERRFRLIGDTDRALVGLIEEDAILSTVCEVLTRGESYRLAFIAAAEPDGTVRVLRSAGKAYPLLSEFELRWDEPAQARDPTGTALRTGEYSVHAAGRGRDYAQFRARARRHGIHGAACVPIDQIANPKMALTVYAGTSSAFDRLEIEAIRSLAHRVGAAVLSARRHGFFVSAKSAYDDLLRNQRDGVILVREGRIVRANPAAVTMLGIGDAVDLAERDPREILVTPENAARLSALLEPGGCGEAAGPLEVPLPRPDGRPFTAEVTATWLPRVDSVVAWEPSLHGPLGMLIFRDITDRRQLEAQIIEMQKMEAVGTLAGGVAHDFNNILTGIIGNLDLALELVTPSSTAVVPLAESLKASQRAAQLVRQLLEFSRRAPLEPRALDMGKVAKEVVRLFSQTIDKRIDVEVTTADGCWPAAADSNQAHQVIMNLCVNARDAVMERLDREEGGVGIRIRIGNAVIDDDYCRLFSYARPGEYVLLSISDDGVGMDAATCKRVFEPFFTTKRLGRGTGLGLSTVYGIVKAHEGWINLESCTDRGTTFRVYLPRAKAAPDEEGLQVAGAPPAARGHETILLVDDEEMIRLLGRRVLENIGYTVLTADDGRKALELYRAERDRVALVIMDQTMPNLSGAEAIAQIRAINPRAKVILSSGYTPGAAAGAPGADWPDAFLQKPYRADALCRVVRDVLDRDGG